MSLPIYQRVAVTDSGDVIPGAEYTVINENTGVAAPIYSDRTGATLLSAPYFADSVGTIQFFIAQGTTFRVAASGGVGTYTDRYVYGVAGAVLTDASGSVDDGGAYPLAISRDGGTDENTSIRFKQLSSSWYAGVNGYNNFGFDTDPDLTNAMLQITSGGNVGIGTSSPDADIHIVPAEADINNPFSGIRVSRTPSLKTSQYGNMSFANGALSLTSTVSGSGGQIKFLTSTNGTSASETMRIDSSGNVGIGTSSPTAAKLQVETASGGTALKVGTATQGVYVKTTGNIVDYNASGNTSGIHTFSTGDNERMRIDSAGNLLVGTTSSPGNKFRVSSNSGNLAYLSNTAGTGVYLVSGATSWTGVSDERVKDIIEPITGAMAKFATLRTVIGKYKTDAEGIRRPFLIAQDVQSVFPEVVDIQDDEAGTLGLQYEGLIPSMIAGMKEQQTLIEALTARITALEAK